MEMFGILVLILDVIAIADAIKGRLSVERKALWILVILLLPVVGMLLYYLLGRTEK